MNQAKAISFDDLVTAMDNGTYATEFSIGDVFPLDLGTEGMNYGKIVAFDTDEKADGSGKAKVSIVATDLLNTEHEMNDDSDSGAWATSSMRSYLSTTINPLIPNNVRSRIVTVNKTYGAGSSDNTRTTQDALWIVSHLEVTGANVLESSGVTYDFGTSDRKRYRKGVADEWWTRSATTDNAQSYQGYNASGAMSQARCHNDRGVLLGFCLD